MTHQPDAKPIDEQMEDASAALVETRYFDAVSIATAALRDAHAAGDHARMARICLPLQEAHRQIRQIATDLGAVIRVSSAEDVPNPIAPGCYLIEPPMIGLDAKVLREQALTAGIAVQTLAREPVAKSGQWPVVAVGGKTQRLQIAPPKTGQPDGGPLPTLAWFQAAAEALGDAAIDGIESGLPAAWRVDDLIECIKALPEHEKLMQALAAACHDAVREKPPEGPRPRPMDGDPYSF